MSIATWEFESPPLHICGNSSVGRAQPCQGWGREFEPRFPLKKFSDSRKIIAFLVFKVFVIIFSAPKFK